MKTFLRGVLSIWLVVLFLVFSIVSNVKGIVVDTSEQLVKKEIKNSVKSAVKEFGGKDISEEALTKIEEEVNKSEAIKGLINKTYDGIFDVLTDKKDNIDVDFSNEMEKLIEEAEVILKDYDIKLSKKEKKEILDSVSKEDINNYINEEVKELKNETGSEVKTIIKTYSFITGTTFKVILIALMIVTLALIALLRKSFYGWLIELGSSAIVTGIALAFMLPAIIEQIVKVIDTENAIVISTLSISSYGYVFLAIGVGAYVINILLTKVLKKKEKEEKILEEK